MRLAWKGNEEYRLKTICCRRMSLSPCIQFQNGKWLLFDQEGEYYKIEFCPFCGTQVTNGSIDKEKRIS